MLLTALNSLQAIFLVDGLKKNNNNSVAAGFCVSYVTLIISVNTVVFVFL